MPDTLRGEFVPDTTKEDSKKVYCEIYTGKRNVDLKKLPEDLSDEEKKEVENVVLALVNNHPDCPENLDLQVLKKWWAEAGSHGGILLGGQDIWDSQKVGEIQGVLIFLPREEYSDGGAAFAEFLKPASSD